MIPEPTAEDLARDAEREYEKHQKHFPISRLSWIRRAGAAERDLQAARERIAEYGALKIVPVPDGGERQANPGDLRYALAELQDEWDTAEKRLFEATNRATVFERQSVELDARIAALEAELATARERIAECLGGPVKEFDLLLASERAAHSRIAALEAANAELTKEVERLKHQPNAEFSAFRTHRTHGPIEL